MKYRENEINVHKNLCLVHKLFVYGKEVIPNMRKNGKKEKNRFRLILDMNSFLVLVIFQIHVEKEGFYLFIFGLGFQVFLLFIFRNLNE